MRPLPLPADRYRLGCCRQQGAIAALRSAGAMPCSFCQPGSSASDSGLRTGISAGRGARPAAARGGGSTSNRAVGRLRPGSAAAMELHSSPWQAVWCDRPARALTVRPGRPLSCWCGPSPRLAGPLLTA